MKSVSFYMTSIGGSMYFNQSKLNSFNLLNLMRSCETILNSLL